VHADSTKVELTRHRKLNPIVLRRIQMARKILKKDLKEPDKFQTYISRIFEFASEYSKQLHIAAGIFILVILIGGGIHIYDLHVEKKAQVLYAEAYGVYKTLNHESDPAKYSQSIQVFEELTKKYPRSDAGLLAFYNLGNIFFDVGEIDKAIDAYNGFLEKSPQDNILTALAYYGLGYCHEAKKDYDGALNAFNKSIEYSTGIFYTTLNYQNIARIYEQMNKPEKAKEYYDKVLEQTTDPLTEKLIKRKISELTD
jgi:predicted negative regulator of RcsB-dependent stress response